MYLKDLNLSAVYNSDDHSLLKDFYIPSLSVSVKYDRAVGYFSAGMLSYAGQGLASFIENGGKMRLIIGYQLEADEFEAVREGANMKNVIGSFLRDFHKTIKDIGDQLTRKRLELLSWMTAAGTLEMKLALRAKGMYHEKMGVLYDKNGDYIVFQGSANETVMALSPDLNYESIAVYPSWKKELIDNYGAPYIEKFETLWNNQSKHTPVVDIPSEAYEKLVSLAPTAKPISEEQELSLYNELRLDKVMERRFSIPKYLYGESFDLHGHQREALNHWKANAYQGILQLATGAGKTITAIYGAVKIYEATKKLFIVVAVPYQNLGDQWCEIFRLFGISPHRCYKTREEWFAEFEHDVGSFCIGALEVCVSVVVNATLKKPFFQELINRIDKDYLFFIGDECHNHASLDHVGKIPLSKYKMGLSATPFPYNDHDGKQRIVKHYGAVVFEYSLEDAIQQKILTPYEYHVRIATLTEEETKEYELLSGKIAMLLSNKDTKAFDQNMLDSLLIKRSRLIGTAQDKLTILNDQLSKQDVESHTLFYCGDGYVEDADDGSRMRQIETVSEILHANGWRTTRFTAEEGLNARRRILDNFKIAAIDALVAIKVLDEGIDIPACRTAFILASSRNPRQFIQRRGRILRKSPGKNISKIYDYLVIPNNTSSYSSSLKALVENELLRVNEFTRLCMNPNEVETIIDPVYTKAGIEKSNPLGQMEEYKYA